MVSTSKRPQVLILGGNFAGLGCAQKLRDYCGDKVDITLIDRRDFLLFVPNILTDVFENHHPADNQVMPLRPLMAKDRIELILGDVTAIDVDRNEVHFIPNERPGAESRRLRYDFLVIALGARLAYDHIEGFAEYGHAVSDLYHGECLRKYLFEGGYKGGPVAIGSALFHQGDGAQGLAPFPGGSIPDSKAACEGPVLEIAMTMANWLKVHNRGNPDLLTIFTPAELIAEDAGVNNARKFLGIASKMGIGYKNNIQDVKRLTADGIEFTNGESLEAELKVILPDWVPHEFLRKLPISDSRGFIVTDLHMRSPKYPNVFAAGDSAAAAVPKLGGLAHGQADMAARQIAKDVGAMKPEDADRPFKYEIFCIGDMGSGKAFYIRANTWFGGSDEVMEFGRVPYQLKMMYRNLFFLQHGRVPDFGLQVAQFMAEKMRL